MIIIKKQFINDIYSMVEVANKIIINDDYNGFILLSEDLNTIKKINTSVKIMIYDFCILKNDKIIYFCFDYENNNISYLIFIDVVSYEIYISKPYDDDNITHVDMCYLVEDNKIVVEAFNKKNYMWNINTNSIREIDNNIYNFQDFIWKGFENGQNLVGDYPRGDMHMYCVKDEVVVTVAEKLINIYLNKNKIMEIEPEYPCYFCRADIMKVNGKYRVFVLSRDESKGENVTYIERIDI